MVEAKEHAKKANDLLLNSATWKNDDPTKVPQVKVIPKRGPNLKDILFKRKSLALQDEKGSVTKPCSNPEHRKRGAKCQCCQLLSGRSLVTNNKKSVKCKGGTCKSNNVIYVATCKLCSQNNVYTGKTVNPLRDRVNGHRSGYYDFARKVKADPNFSIDFNEIEDEKILGAHLVAVHNKLEKDDFNRSYNFDIVAFSNPGDIRIKEQFFIDTLGTLTPFGLNQVNSLTG